MTDELRAAALEAAILGTPFAGRVEVHERLSSTIDRCRALAEAGAPAGAVVLARAQDAGRGQPGHAWYSPDGGGLYMSVLLRPPLAAEAARVLAPLAGLAACEALRGLGVPCRLKLPNDILAPLAGTWRKLGGLLVDTAIQGDVLRHAIVSVGVNVAIPAASFPPELRDVAASCADVAARAPSREEVAATFLRELAGLAEHLAAPSGWQEIWARHARHVRDIRPGASAPDAED